MFRRAVLLATAMSAAPVPAAAQDQRAPATPTRDPSAQEDRSETQQSALGDIVVTAERRESTVQDTAASVAVRNGDALREQGRFTLAQILEDVPGVSTGPSEPNAPGNGVVIRGVLPATTPAGVSGVPTTAVYVDGVYNGIGGGYDIDRVEVLRGPQGTLYGRSATGGVVSLYTRDPSTDRVGGEANFEAGSLNLVHASGALNLPIVGDAVALRVSGNHYERDGAVSEEGGRREINDGRAKLLLRPLDGLSVMIAGVYQHQRNASGGATVAADTSSGDTDDFVISSAPVFTTTSEFKQAYANVTADVGFAQVTYIPSFRRYTRSGSQLIANVIAQTNSTPRDDLHTEELRLASKAASPVQWVTGLFYYDDDERVGTTTRWLSSGGLVFDQLIRRQTRNEAAFGEVTLPLRSTIRLTGGVRYDHTRVQTDLSYLQNTNTNDAPFGPRAGLPERNVLLQLAGDAGRSTFDKVTYKGRIEADLSPSNLAYAMVSSGSLPGDVQATVGAGNQPAPLRYRQQELTAYEVGTKNRFADVFQVNGSAFYYDYSGYQTTINVGIGPAPIYIITTTPAEMYGFELEALLALSKDDRITASAGYTHARFTDEPSIEPTGRSGDRIPGIAPWRLTVAYDKQVGLDFQTRLNAHAQVRYETAYQSAALTNAFVDLGALPYSRIRARAFVDVNATISFYDGRFQLVGYVRNLFDKVTASGVSVNGAPPFPGAPPFLTDVTLTDPRTAGVIGRITF